MPLDLQGGLLQPAWDAGARILSNSWSCRFPEVRRARARPGAPSRAERGA